MAQVAGITDFLSPETMRRLDQMQLRSRLVVEGFQVGMHASPLKGSSVEFTDYRQYAKGDNLRLLDWKVLGRTERYYIKQFEEETNLRLHVLLDASGSMGYSSHMDLPTKYQYACKIAAAFGYLVTKQQDSLGLTVFDREIREHIPARSGPRHLRVVLERLGANQPKGRTDTAKALHAIAEMVFRRGLILMLTDLYDDPEAVFQAIAHFRKKMHDVILLQILDPVELELSLPRSAIFVDMETGEKLELDPRAARLAYKEALQKAIDNFRERCTILNVDYRLVSTGDPFEQFAVHYLAERRRMSL